MKKDMLILVIEATAKCMFGWLQDYLKDIFSSLYIYFGDTPLVKFSKDIYFSAFEASKIMSLIFFFFGKDFLLHSTTIIEHQV